MSKTVLKALNSWEKAIKYSYDTGKGKYQQYYLGDAHLVLKRIIPLIRSGRQLSLESAYSLLGVEDIECPVIVYNYLFNKCEKG
jgi:hypothetical protein